MRHDDPTKNGGPRILVGGTFGTPFYRAADFPDPLDVEELTAGERGCLALELAEWLAEVEAAAEVLRVELIEVTERDAVGDEPIHPSRAVFEANVREALLDAGRIAF
jgi:hypothetical protein